MLPSETMIWQPEFTDKTLSRKPGAVQTGDNSALCVIFLQPALSVRVKTRRFSWRTRFNQGVFDGFA
ncbi:hypothetical protein [Escherichia coli]|uniref:hypothetical protein n=1 Tax=Escherichia coli TaxID=562 RepID=UPI000BE49283|nr:hypothetical protein [Escherichia coli]